MISLALASRERRTCWLSGALGNLARFVAGLKLPVVYVAHYKCRNR